MKKPNGRTMAAIAVAVGAITYGALTLLSPHHREEVTLEGLVPTESVFGDKAVAAPTEVAQAAAAIPVAEPAAPPPAEIAAETVGSDIAPPPDEPVEVPAKAPAAPVAAPATPVKPKPVAPAAKPEPQAPPPPAKPAPKVEPPVAAVKPAAKPEAKKTEEKKAPEKKPQEKKPAAPAKPETPAAGPRVPAVAWWINQNPAALQISYVGSAAFKRAIVIMAGGNFASAAAADQHIAVLTPDGRRLSGQWELSPANRSMLVFSIPDAGPYQVIIGGAFSDQQNRAVGTTLRGSVQVQ